MGSIVGAFATSHVLLDRNGCEEAADRVFAGMREILARIDKLDPDGVIIIGNDHFVNFDLAHEIPFGVPMQDEYLPAGDSGLPVKPFRGWPEFSGGLVDYTNSHGFDLAILREYRPCHGITVPSYFSAPHMSRPIVPVVTNTMMSPPLSPQRCFKLGETIADYVEQVRPGHERIVIVATGGLSHWVGVEGEGRVNADFDAEVFALFAEGRSPELAGLSVDEIVAKAGNGGLELINWIALAGATRGRPGSKVYYEPMPQWMTGMAGLEVAV